MVRLESAALAGARCVPLDAARILEVIEAGAREAFSCFQLKAYCSGRPAWPLASQSLPGGGPPDEEDEDLDDEDDEDLDDEDDEDEDDDEDLDDEDDEDLDDEDVDDEDC